MTRVEKRLAIRTGALGIILALLVVAADYFDLLSALENWCYDHRARYCQFYTPPPSEQFVHVDIDDQSLSAIGHWPWTGTTLGELIDEIHIAGPKVVTLDFIWPERQRTEPVTEKRGKDEFVTSYINHDKNFAEALAKSGNVIIPASMGKRSEPQPLQDEVTKILAGDLELSTEEVVDRLAQKNIKGPGVAAQVKACIADATTLAVRQRLADEMRGGDKTLAQLTAKLLPKQTNPPAALRKEIDEALLRWQSLAALHSLARHDVTTPMFQVEREIASLPEIMSAAKGTAFVDYLTTTDGIVRSVPLWVMSGDNAYPQMGFAAACAMLDLDPRDAQRVVIEPARVTLVPPKGDRIVIPLTVGTSRGSQQVPGTFAIPWRGPHGDWEHMYADAKSPHHVIIRDIYQIVLTRRAMTGNLNEIDEAIRACLQQTGDRRFDEFIAHPPPRDDVAVRLKLSRDIVAAIPTDPVFSGYVGKKPSMFTEESEKKVAAQLEAVQEFVSRSDQLQLQRDSLAAKLKDKAVLIGSTATAMADFRPTSLHANCPGVVIHGAILNGILTGEMWRSAPRIVTSLVTLLAGLLMTLAVAFLSSWKSAIAAAVELVAYLGINGVLLFDAGNILIGLAGPIVAIATVWAGCTLYRLLAEQRERAVVTRRFRTYVDPSLVNHVLEHPERARMDGELREVTVVYTDLVGFTTLSQKLGERVVPILNSYFDVMVPLVRTNHGYLNKFLGDGIMFFFGAPRDSENHAADAVKTVLEMQAALPAFNDGLLAQGLPKIGMRAGVSTGKMVVGDAGAKDASDYTVLGDYSNLGARLESANKAVGTSNLLSVRTVELMGDGVLVRPIGRLQVVGRDSYIMTYEAFCNKDIATDRHLKLVAMTEKMVHAYFEGRFQQCLAAVEDMEAAFGPDKLTDIYREWATKHLNGIPAEEFTGQIVLESK